MLTTSWRAPFGLFNRCESGKILCWWHQCLYHQVTLNENYNHNVTLWKNLHFIFCITFYSPFITIRCADVLPANWTGTSSSGRPELSLLLFLSPTWGLSPTSLIIFFCPDFILLCIAFLTSSSAAATSSSYKILSRFAPHLIKEGSSSVSEIKWNFKPLHICVLLQREWNKRELSKKAMFLIYSDEWCEQRGFDAEVPVCSSLFRRDSSPICTSADLFFFLHKPNNLFLCKAVHPFEIFYSSQDPDVTFLSWRNGDFCSCSYFAEFVSQPPTIME